MAITPISFPGGVPVSPAYTSGLEFAPNPATDGAESPFSLLLAKAEEAAAAGTQQTLSDAMLDNPSLPILKVTQSFLGEISAAASKGDLRALNFASFVAQSIQVDKDEQAEQAQREKIQAILAYELNLKSRLASVFNLPVGAQQEVLAAVKRTQEQNADWMHRHQVHYI